MHRLLMSGAIGATFVPAVSRRAATQPDDARGCRRSAATGSAPAPGRLAAALAHDGALIEARDRVGAAS